jgi:branched-chain amino acid transport system substrate-binding protein
MSDASLTQDDRGATVRRKSKVIIVAGLLATMSACSDDGESGSASSTSGVETTGVTADATTESSVSPSGPPGSSGPASGEPIVVGTLFVEASGIIEVANRDALESLFAAWNAEGGVAGRPIELASANGGLDPAATAAAARQLVEEDQVVAMVLPLSPVDCQANGQYYETQQITVLFSISDECGSLATTFPNGASFAETLRVPAHWAVTDEGRRRVAYIGVDVPSSRSEASAIRTQVEADGGELVMEEYVPFVGVDATSIVARMVQNDVDAVIAGVNPTELLTFLSIADSQGVGIPDDVTWIGSPVAYDEDVVAQLGATGDELVTFTPNVPFADPQLDDLLATWRSDDAERSMTGTVATSWLAADVLRQLIESIDGEVTRESMLAAATAASEFDSVVSPVPVAFNASGPVAAAGYVLRIDGGTFSAASGLITLD